LVKESGRSNFALYGETIDKNIYQSSTSEQIKRKPHIFIIEDNSVDYRMLSHSFDKSFVVEQSKSGDDALKFLDRYGQSISIIILDLFISGMNGFEILEKINKNEGLKDIPIIVISEDERKETCLKAIRAGAHDFITKPLDSSLIVQKVKSILEHTK
jgi:putative two-component system response regulator